MGEGRKVLIVVWRGWMDGWTDGNLLEYLRYLGIQLNGPKQRGKIENREYSLFASDVPFVEP